MKRHIQTRIKPTFSVGNNELSDYIPVVLSALLAYLLPIPLSFQLLIVYIGYEMTKVVTEIKKYFPRSFFSYVKYKFGIGKMNSFPKSKIREFSGS